MVLEYQVNYIKGSSKINIEFREPAHKYGTKAFTYSTTIKNPGSMEDLEKVINDVNIAYTLHQGGK